MIMASKKQKKLKTFELDCVVQYPCRLSIKASSKQEAMEMMEDKDKWHLVSQDHDLANWKFLDFYIEDLKEKPKKTATKPGELTKDQLYQVFKDNEGLK